MGDPLTVADWPPSPIHTDRLVLRAPEARDRAGFVDLLTEPEVSRYLGGPRERAAVEDAIPAIPADRPGNFVVEVGGGFIGWAAARFDEPVLLCTQTANARSVSLAVRLGFTEAERFDEFGAEQWLGVRHPG